MTTQTPYNRDRRKQFAQNYLKNPSLGRKLVEQAQFSKNDHILEIGVGRGVLTQPLVDTGAQVTGLDTDQNNIDLVYSLVGDASNLTLLNQDALSYKVDSSTPYHLFANIPFTITSQIVKNYCLKKPFPHSVHLFMQTEAAQRFCGNKKPNMISVLLDTVYTIEIIHHFKKTDYTPAPSVDSVLLRMTKLPTDEIIENNWGEYKDFVSFGFSEPIKSLQKKYKDKIAPAHFALFFEQTKINPATTTPLMLSAQEWRVLFTITHV